MLDQTRRSLIGGSGRRAHAEENAQGWEQGLRRGVKGREEGHLAKRPVGGGPVDLETKFPLRARQVFDERLAHGARSIASSRKGRRVGSCKGLVRVKDGRLVAR
jgi:hypothetical protein